LINFDRLKALVKLYARAFYYCKTLNNDPVALLNNYLNKVPIMYFISVVTIDIIVEKDHLNHT
jgi:hypothetical protein